MESFLDDQLFFFVFFFNFFYLRGLITEMSRQEHEGVIEMSLSVISQFLPLLPPKVGNM